MIFTVIQNNSSRRT